MKRIKDEFKELEDGALGVLESQKELQQLVDDKAWGGVFRTLTSSITLPGPTATLPGALPSIVRTRLQPSKGTCWPWPEPAA